jgi:hypothetical protein
MRRRFQRRLVDAHQPHHGRWHNDHATDDGRRNGD